MAEEERNLVHTIEVSRMKEIRCSVVNNDKGTFVDLRTFVTPYDAADDDERVATKMAIRFKVDKLNDLDKAVKELKKYVKSNVETDGDS
jgi:hypothetical protein